MAQSTSSFLFFFLNKFIYLFSFGCVGSFIAAQGFSLVAESWGYFALRRTGFALRSTGSRHVGFSSCSSRALERRLSSCGART